MILDVDDNGLNCHLFTFFSLRFKIQSFDFSILCWTDSGNENLISNTKHNAFICKHKRYLNVLLSAKAEFFYENFFMCPEWIYISFFHAKYKFVGFSKKWIFQLKLKTHCSHVDIFRWYFTYHWAHISGWYTAFHTVYIWVLEQFAVSQKYELWNNIT